MIPTRSNDDSSAMSLPISDVAILGILYESIHDYNRPLTGKEINDVIDLANYKYWVDIEFSTAYNCLKRLETLGLVKGKYSKRNNRRVKLFRLTKQGETQFIEEIQKSLSSVVRTKNPLDLGIKNMFALTKENAMKYLKGYEKELENSIIYYERMVDNLSRGKPGETVEHIPITVDNLRKISLVIALFERPYLELKARRRWLKNFLDRIISKNIDW